MQVPALPTSAKGAGVFDKTNDQMNARTDMKRIPLYVRVPTMDHRPDVQLAEHTSFIQGGGRLLPV